ncbi:cationic amino acid transporter 2-like [Hydractinia symbiolongicarpus]|uniref:cationic amino acid transporter 2-like n=1 Tax=Hydractinia symbiolongicarpus TaxID=13093 RepID=UPI00254B2006|nr:cationic amino acid transporter 2-like [Hydractinia symbiolongicarpus]
MALLNFVSFIGNACVQKKSLKASSNTDTKLRRCLTTLDLTSIGIGSTLGTGIYVLIGDVARNKAGPAIIVSFLIAAVASFLSGLCYAEFGARIPKAGSAYAYCYLTIGELFAFLIGWNIILEYIISSAAVAKSVTMMLDSLIYGVIKKETIALLGEMHVKGFNQYFDLFTFCLAMLCMAFLLFGIKQSAYVNNFCVTVNLLSLSIVIMVGLMHANFENWHSFAPYGVKGIISGSSTCFFAFVGFDAIATMSEEAKNPSLSIPFSMISTIGVCTVLYIGVSATVTLMVPYYELNENAAISDSFSKIKLYSMHTFVAVNALITLSGSLIFSMIAPTRLIYAMAEDGMLMNLFGTVSEKGVPTVATIVVGMIIGFMAAVLDLNSLVEMLSIGTLMAYFAVDICVLILRYRPVKDSEMPLNLIGNKESKDQKEKYKNERSTSVRSPEKNTNETMLVHASLFLIISTLFGICLLFSQYGHKLLEKKFGFIFILVVLLIMLLAACFYLSRLKTNIEGLSFTVPLVPWVPVIALFFNIYLMLELSHLTWIRFGVWMAGGMVLYFGYSIHNSAERESNSEANDLQE